MPAKAGIQTIIVTFKKVTNFDIFRKQIKAFRFYFTEVIPTSFVSFGITLWIPAFAGMTSGF